jgi:uncharacterized protein (DUF736 family)
VTNATQLQEIGEFSISSSHPSAIHPTIHPTIYLVHAEIRLRVSEEKSRPSFRTFASFIREELGADPWNKLRNQVNDLCATARRDNDSRLSHLGFSTLISRAKVTTRESPKVLPCTFHMKLSVFEFTLISFLKIKSRF